MSTLMNCGSSSNCRSRRTRPTRCEPGIVGDEELRAVRLVEELELFLSCSAFRLIERNFRHLKRRPPTVSRWCPKKTGTPVLDDDQGGDDGIQRERADQDAPGEDDVEGPFERFARGALRTDAQGEGTQGFDLLPADAGAAGRFPDIPEDGRADHVVRRGERAAGAEPDRPTSLAASSTAAEASIQTPSEGVADPVDGGVRSIPRRHEVLGVLHDVVGGGEAVEAAPDGGDVPKGKGGRRGGSRRPALGDAGGFLPQAGDLGVRW